MCRKIHKAVASINIITEEVITYGTRYEIGNLGFDTCKIGQSIKNPKFSHKGCLWLYADSISEQEIQYRLLMYRNKTRKLVSTLFPKCRVCKTEKKWLDFYNDGNKGNKLPEECAV